MNTLFYTTYAYPPPFDEGSINYQFNVVSNLNSFDTTVICPQRPVKSGSTADARVLETSKHKLCYRHYMNFCRSFGLLWSMPMLFLDYCWAKLKGKADVLGCGYIYPLGLVALLSKLLFRQKYFLFIYAEELPVWAKRSPFKRHVMALVLRFADKVITVSDYSVGLLRSMYDFPLEKISKVLPAVRPPNLDLESSQAAKQGRILLTASRLEERKGQDITILAVAKLAPEFPDLSYIICGKGPYEPRLRQLVAEHKLEAQVKFTGFASDADLQSYYRQADVFILANRELANGDTEGCPTVLLEASSYGLPVIAGKFGGTADAVLHKQTGEIIDSTNVEEVAATIRRFLLDAELARTYGRQGRSYALSCTPEKQGAKADVALKDLCFD